MTFLHKLAKRLALIPTALACTISLLASCSEGTAHEYLGPDPTKPNPAGAYIGLSITPHDPQIVQGDSVYFQALGWLPSGLSTPASVTWSAAGGSVTGAGWFRPTSAGSFRVRAVSTTNAALSDSVLVTVIPSGGIARLDITPSAVPLAAGTKQQFTAVALMGDGTRTYPTVTWTATGGSITATGLFTAAGTPGGYTVTARIGGGALLGLTAGLVDAAVLTGLSITPEALMVESGTVRQFVPTASWSDGSTFVPPLTWSATGGSVTSSGAFTAGNTPGTYRVIASSALGKADTASVTIMPRIVSIRLAPLTALLALEATQVVTAYGLRNDGTESPVGVTWTAQGGSISLDGVYAAGTTPGIYPVVGTLTALNGSIFSDTAYFEVGTDDAAIVQIFVKPDTSVQVGSRVQFSASGLTSSGGSAVPAVTWSATGGTIDSKGNYTAGPVPGDYKVIGKKKNGTTADTANIVILSAPTVTVSAFTVSPQTDILGSGQSRQFSATLTWNDAGVHPTNISWVSAGGTITQNGLYTAGTVAGTFLVIATCGCGAADTASVTIPASAAPPVTLSQLVLSPPTVQLDPGAAQIFTVAGVWSDGATSQPGVVFTATGGSISSAGAYIAGNAPGTYNVIATQAGGGKADTSIVTIVAGPPGSATLTQLVLNPSAVTVPKGATQAFVVSASWSDGSTTVPPVTFDPTGGTVSADGVYTAGTTAGTYRLIVTHTGGTKADTSVITIPAAVTLNSLVLNPSTVSMTAGGNQQFAVSGSWSDGSSVAPAVTWIAGGGSITPAGLYTAGSVSGTYQVIARHFTGTKADTSAVTIGVAPPPPPSGGPAELPRVLLNTTYSAPTGAMISVPAGGNLQAAIDGAACGSEITLASGATFAGNFVLPANKDCSTNPIHLRTAGTLPAEGVRVTPAGATGFAKVVTPNTSSALLARNGAAGWRIIAVEITATAQGAGVNYNYGLVRLGDDETSVAALPHDIVLDRVYIHGGPGLSTQRGVTLNSARTAIIDSDVRDIYWPGTQTQAVGGWAGTGPFKIVNNYLEATSENIIFGGADPRITNLTPSDIEIRRNHLFKPLAWRNSGKNPICNLLELKHAKRVLIEGNVLENSWSECQSGMAFNIQSLSDANNPWTQTADITIRYNLIRNVNQCAVFLAHGWNGSGIALARVTFEHNFCDGIGEGENNTGVMLSSDLRDIRIARNTFRHRPTGGGTPFYLNFTGGQNLAVLDNIVFPAPLYGPVISDNGMGTAGLTSQFGATWSFAGNVMQETAQWANAPAGNTYLTSLVMNADGSVPAHPGKGADIPTLLSMVAGVAP